MSRNYENEMKWAKEKYIRFEAKIDASEYAETAEKIKNEIGKASFIKQALELYKSNPELFNKQKD